MIVTIDEVKKHLEIDLDESRDDEYLYSLIKVAEEDAQDFINVDLTTYNPVPWRIKHAIKVRVANLYDVDRAETENVKPSKIFYRLLSAFVNYSPDVTTTTV